jgi:hypothetical protein
MKFHHILASTRRATPPRRGLSRADGDMVEFRFQATCGQPKSKEVQRYEFSRLEPTRVFKVD